VADHGAVLGGRSRSGRTTARADTASIAAFQIGLFGWMALDHFVIFTHPHLHVNEAVYWFMMQIGMIVGWFTSWPATRLLLSAHWKERMPQ
jgi:Domain of unknown function (DUF4396)